MSNSQAPEHNHARHCRFCGAGEMRPGVTSITVERNGMSVTIRNIPALICDACGEAYYDVETSIKLFALADALVKVGLSGVTVEVSGKAA